MAELLRICADDIKLSQLEEFPGTVLVMVASVLMQSHSQATPTLIFVYCCLLQ